MSELQVREMATRAAEHIRARARHNPQVGVILGSGLNPLADAVQDAVVLPYDEIPYFPHSTVPGHAGQLVLGVLSGVPLALMQGRAHYYEGYSAAEITLPIRAMQLLGVSALLVTNAAGGIRPGMRAGDLMAIVDHINLVGMAGNHPLRGPNDDLLGPRFPGMTRTYDPGLLDLLRQEAQSQGIILHEGVYVMVAGPSFETPAEIRFLRMIGADAVGMSTVPEVTVARHGGMRVLGISLISNLAVDSLTAPTEEASHAEVLEAGQRAVPALAVLLEGVLRRLAPPSKD